MNAMNIVKYNLVAYLSTSLDPSRSDFVVKVCKLENLSPSFVGECLNALAAVYPTALGALRG